MKEEPGNYEPRIFGIDLHRIESDDLVETSALETQTLNESDSKSERAESDNDTIDVGQSWLLKNIPAEQSEPHVFKQASPRGKGGARVTIPFPQYGPLDENRAGVFRPAKSAPVAGDVVHQKSMHELLEKQRSSYSQVLEVLGVSERGKNSIDPTRPDLWSKEKQALFPQLVEGVIRAGMDYKLDEDNIPETDLVNYKNEIESVRIKVYNEMSKKTRPLDSVAVESEN